MKSAMIIVLLSTCISIGYGKTIELPQDTVLWRPSQLPGYKLALSRCSACHSAHYAEYQPPNSSISYWNTQVLRMRNIFKAQITEEEVPIIVEYLNKTYGANKQSI